MKLLLIFLPFLSPLMIVAQSLPLNTSDSSLESEIETMDSLLFDVAFNTCDIELFKSILVEGLEFYDDRTGLNTDISKEYAAVEDKCSQPFSVTRKLIKHTIHPLGEYGAVQMGTHIFLNDSKVVQSAEFVTIWERREQSWVVKRAVSYDHKDM
ncbi:MAG: nuclear transport factor 2 family protein [Bacteroidota bacterium]